MGHNSRITDIDYSHSNNLLLSSSCDGTAKLWRHGQIDAPLLEFSHDLRQPEGKE